jgi:hypothetical protein
MEVKNKNDFGKNDMPSHLMPPETKRIVVRMCRESGDGKDALDDTCRRVLPVPLIRVVKEEMMNHCPRHLQASA